MTARSAKGRSAGKSYFLSDSDADLAREAATSTAVFKMQLSMFNRIQSKCMLMETGIQE